jgi:hypothetical protein
VRPVVYKTFGAIVPTTGVTDELLAEPDLLRWTPGIYQHYVEKDHELRVTVIGRRLFAIRINSQATARGQVDWREAQRTPPAKSPISPLNRRLCRRPSRPAACAS